MLTRNGNFIIHLVFRFSDRLLKINDTVLEHNKIIEKYGAVWFAKLGKPVGKPHIESMRAQIEDSIPTYLYIVQKQSGAYIYYRGSVSEITKDTPLHEKELFPNYYSLKFDVTQVKFWTKLTQLVKVEEDEIRQLRSISSSVPLPNTLASSMAGFFIVRRYERIRLAR